MIEVIVEENITVIEVSEEVLAIQVAIDAAQQSKDYRDQSQQIASGISDSVQQVESIKSDVEQLRIESEQQADRASDEADKATEQAGISTQASIDVSLIKGQIETIQGDVNEKDYFVSINTAATIQAKESVDESLSTVLQAKDDVIALSTSTIANINNAGESALQEVATAKNAVIGEITPLVNDVTDKASQVAIDAEQVATDRGIVATNLGLTETAKTEAQTAAGEITDKIDFTGLQSGDLLRYNGTKLVRISEVDFLKAKLALKPVKNLFGGSLVVLDASISITGGYSIAIAAGRAYTRIPVSPNTNYVISDLSNPTNKGLRFEDADKNLISGVTVGDAPLVPILSRGSRLITTPSSCFFIAFTIKIVSNENWNSLQVEEGSFSTEFEEYRENVSGILGYDLQNDNTSRNRWFGKTATVVGDSISYGFVPRNDPSYPGQLNSYAKLASERMGINLLNNGISGSTLGTIDIGGTSRSPFVYRVSEIPIQSDLIIIMGGTNDIRFINNLGTFGDTAETSYYGALDFLCAALLERFRYSQGISEGAKKTVIFCTPIKTLGYNLAPYATAVKEVCANYGIPVLDFYSLSGMTPDLFRTQQGTDTGYTDIYNPYVPDGVHPNQQGHLIMSNVLEGFLKTI